MMETEEMTFTPPQMRRIREAVEGTLYDLENLSFKDGQTAHEIRQYKELLAQINRMEPLARW